MARKFGLVPENRNFQEWLQRTDRTIKAGQAIHHANLQDQRNKFISAQNAKNENSEATEKDSI